MKATPLEKVLDALGASCRQSSSGYSARCPAHDDNQPSLSIAESENGKLLLKCHAGCSTENVLKALGLTMKDLFPDVAVTETARDSNKKQVSAMARGGKRVYETASAAINELERCHGKRSPLCQ